jgi:hypothetical protein
MAEVQVLSSCAKMALLKFYYLTLIDLFWVLIFGIILLNLSTFTFFSLEENLVITALAISYKRN